MKKDKNKLKKIKTSAFSRGLSVLSLGAKAGMGWTGMKTANLFRDNEGERTALDKFILQQALKFTENLGEMKGSLMKAGQLLSTYGEHFLHPKAVEALKTLQNDSPPLEWEQISKILEVELGDRLDELEIQQEAHACASLGQVHIARIKATGEKIALKIQYKGLESAIDSDLKILKKFMAIAAAVPKDFDFRPLFEEIKQMLVQELSYKKELELTETYRKKLKSLDNASLIIPKTYAEFSTNKILATEFIVGCRLDSDTVLSLNQNRRNRLALLSLELYYNEIFQWGMVQTDPHFGNYLVQVGNSIEEDKLVLIDFGAVRIVGEEFSLPYKEMIRALVHLNFSDFEEAAAKLGFLQQEDSEELLDLFRSFCLILIEAFMEEAHKTSEFYLEDGNYDFAASDLPERVIAGAKSLILGFKMRTPPKELVFLDRKLGGIFTILAKLGAKIDARPLLLHYLK